MTKTQYIKWFLELCNQEYEGDVRLLRSNISNYSILDGDYNEKLL